MFWEHINLFLSPEKMTFNWKGVFFWPSPGTGLTLAGGWLVDWLVGWLVGWSVGWLVGWERFTIGLGWVWCSPFRVGRGPASF